MPVPFQFQFPRFKELESSLIPPILFSHHPLSYYGQHYSIIATLPCLLSPVLLNTKTIISVHPYYPIHVCQVNVSKTRLGTCIVPSFIP